MATELTPDDAVQAIRALTRMLETLAQDLHAFTVRSERWMRWYGWGMALVLPLTGVLLFASVGMYIASAHTHTAQNEALRLIIQENRAIFERLAR